MWAGSAVLVLVGGASARAILFCRPRNLEREIWDGFRYGPEAAREAFGMDEGLSIEVLDEEIPKLLGDRERVYFAFGADPAWEVLALLREVVDADGHNGVVP